MLSRGKPRAGHTPQKGKDGVPQKLGLICPSRDLEFPWSGSDDKQAESYHRHWSDPNMPKR